jgi:hypothetical protein
LKLNSISSFKFIRKVKFAYTEFSYCQSSFVFDSLNLSDMVKPNLIR